MGRLLGERFFIRLLSISAAIIASVLVVNMFTSSTLKENDDKSNQPSDDIHSTCVPMPANLDFCGEAVPLDRQDVIEALDRELLVNTYFHSQTILFLKRSQRYYPVLERLLKEYGVPEDFKYLCTIESNLMPRAISPAGAAGFWQILAKTATELGLEVNEEVDERYHLEKSTWAACQYLKKAHQRYGNWTTAAASYNAGFRGIQRQSDKQKMESYYDLLFGEETGRYVYRILAVKTILNNPEKYGYFVSPHERYNPYSTVDYVTNESIADIAEFAISKGTSYKILKDLNPWLRDNKLTNRLKKSYTIKLPAPSHQAETDEEQKL